MRQVEGRLDAAPPAGQFLGDGDRDGDVDGDDLYSAFSVFITGEYDARFDLDADGELDAEDWEALNDLIEAHGGDPVRGPAPTPAF